MVLYKIIIGCLSILLIGSLAPGVSVKAATPRDGAKKSLLSESFSQVSGQSMLKPRLLVLTDMTSIKAGVREPDDAQSMIRLMLYANAFDIEGLIASSGLRHGHVVRPEIIREIVAAYAKVRPNLASNSKGYPSAARLRDVIKSGQPDADKGMPVYKSVGEGKDTQASRWIIRMVDKPDKRPLWITIWGGSADLAQALWRVRKTRSPQEVTRFISKIRVIASGDQDSTGPWIKSRFPTLFYVTRGEGGRGMYRGGDQSLVSSAWVQTNIKGHGALGNLYPDYRGGDKWSWKHGKIHGIKSGDSASFMGLIHNGLNRPGHLTWENWGGRIKQSAINPHHYHDAIDPVGNYKTDLSPYLAAVYRWRETFQANYAARFDWCVLPYSQTNHAPVKSHGVAVINRLITAGKKVTLQSGNWRDPDGNSLTFHWQVLKAESTYPKAMAIRERYVRPSQRWQMPNAGRFYLNNIKIENKQSQSAEFNAPAIKHPQSLHVLLTVTDDGHPALTSYQRFNFIVYP